MVEIIEITPSMIRLKGVNFTDGERVEKIMEICHKYKHLYKDGYPCGRKTRKEKKYRFRKWAQYPGICFTYLVTNDNEGHFLEIHILVSDKETLLKKYTEQDIEYYMQMYTQGVADEIIGTI